MGSATGPFRPGPGYDLVQPVFRLFAEAQGDGSEETADQTKLTRYYAARDRLGLSLHTSAGAFIPTEFIHIVDFTLEQGPDALGLQVAVRSSHAWRALEPPQGDAPDA